MAEERTCLHCEQTPSQIKRDHTICGIEGGYEYRELEAEWPRHRWADWGDKELARHGIRPEAYERHRRTPVTHLQWVACVDTERGHVYGEEGNAWGEPPDRCIACGHRKEPSPVETITIVTPGEHTVVEIGPSKTFYGLPQDDNEDRNEDD